MSSTIIGYSQEDQVILKIRDNFQKWQPLIEDNDTQKSIFKYAWGTNYQYTGWYNSENTLDSLTLMQTASTINDNSLGSYLNVDLYSLAGDWYITSDYYYNQLGNLYFIFWRMNTFYAEEPVTVEKRKYFDSKGNEIRSLQSVYKMNTKDKIEISFMDREVDIKKSIKDWEFYELLKD